LLFVIAANSLPFCFSKCDLGVPKEKIWKGHLWECGETGGQDQNSCISGKDIKFTQIIFKALEIRSRFWIRSSDLKCLSHTCSVFHHTAGVNHNKGVGHAF
jgi:hypothetical protein